MAELTQDQRPNYALRNTPGGLPGVVIEHLEDGTTQRTPVTSHSLRAVSAPTDGVEEAAMPDFLGAKLRREAGDFQESLRQREESNGVE